MAGKCENTIQDKGKSIPEDVIEAIMLRLPVKSLIRFQLLSKSCKAIISTPSFSKINYNHLPQSHNHFLHGNREKELFYLVRSSDLRKEAEFESPIGPAVPLCSCNGIVLLLPMYKSGELVLWNPCIGRYTRIPIPHHMYAMNVGLYHDSRTDDYRIAIYSVQSNIVYSCKTRTWAEEELIPCCWAAREGVFVDGCLYWYKGRHNPLCREILCFDFRERKMEVLKLPDHLYGKYGLTKLRGRLCLDPFDTADQVWGRENDGFRDLTDMVKTGIQLCHGSINVYNRKVVSVGNYPSHFVMYNDCEESFEEVKIPGVSRDELVPYSESLLFPF